MRWGIEDKAKFCGEVSKELNRPGPKGKMLNRLVRLITDTLFIYGCPVQKIAVGMMLFSFIILCEESGLRKKIKESANFTPIQFLVAFIAEWVGNTINRNEEEKP